MESNQVIGYIPTRWKLQELVDKATFEKHGVLAWRLIDERMRKFADGLSLALEQHYGKHIRLICNNWLWHRNPNASDYFQWRGLRTKDCSLYNPKRFHCRVPCMALDIDSPDIKAYELRKFVIDHQHEDWCKDIGAVEKDVNWLHADCRLRGSDDTIMLFKA